MIYAVFDTNVLLSALITHNANASTVKVVEAIGDGKVVTPAEMVGILGL